MSFSPENFRSKLDTLQDTQDSIVSISQWVLFHHRHAAQLCQLWADYTLENVSAFSSKKKLSLLYLCNDVVQQARHKRKPEFAAGFAAILPQVLHVIYPTVGTDIQPKMERLVSVWDQRNIFSRDQITAMKNALAASKTGADLGSPSPVSVPEVTVDPSLAPLNGLFLAISKASATSTSNLASISSQSDTYLPEDPSTSESLPSPQVYISKLNMLEKLMNITSTTLADAEKAQTQALSILAELTTELTTSISTCQKNQAYIQAKLPQLHSVRDELKQMVTESSVSTGTESEEPSPSFEESSPAFEEPSPSFEQAPPAQKPSVPAYTQTPKPQESTASSGDFGGVPTYDSSSDDSDDEPKKRPFPEPDSRPLKKSVAFSEEIQIKEFERDERELSSQTTGHSDDFTAHHKDALELKHEHDAGSGDEEYDPSQLEDQKADLMDLLSKLN